MTCSLCNKTGHNKNTCSNNNNKKSSVKNKGTGAGGAKTTVNGKTFEHRGSALRHAETLYDENPDNEIMFVVVDNNNEGYGAVPGIIDSPLSRFATGFSKGY
jgi:hypothetical protein